MSNQDALKIYSTLDVMIDQLKIGWYGGLAVESAGLGIPTIVYLRESDLELVPAEFRKSLPFVSADTKSIVDVLARCASLTTGDFQELQKYSKRFVMNFHDPVKIAQGILRDLDV
jgi:hypothetical protein